MTRIEVMSSSDDVTAAAPEAEMFQQRSHNVLLVHRFKPALGIDHRISEAEYAVITPQTAAFPFQDDLMTSSSPSNWTLGKDGGVSGEWWTGNLVVTTVIMVTIMTTAVVGNVLVVTSVLCYDRLRRVANSYIVSLAFADLLVAVLVMPFNASQVTVYYCLLSGHGLSEERASIVK